MEWITTYVTHNVSLPLTERTLLENLCAGSLVIRSSGYYGKLFILYGLNRSLPLFSVKYLLWEKSEQTYTNTEVTNLWTKTLLASAP